MKKRIIVCLAIVVFTLLTIPSISAIESNTVLNLKKSFSNKSPELIKEQIKNNLLPRENDTLLFIILSVLLTMISYRLITHNHIALGTLFLFANLIMLINFANT